MNHDHSDDVTVGRMLSRREVLALLGASAGAGAVVAWAPSFLRCGGGIAMAAEPCIVRPEQTEGPYFVDERLNRSDIRTDPGTGVAKLGAELALTFAVQRHQGSSCVPLAGALVDLWHCDAAGIYSDVEDAGFNTVGQMFLRGYQLTDANGEAAFITIYPGWYQGRTVHMHFKVRTDPDSSAGFEFTSQLFFDDALTDVVHGQQPYAAKGQRTLRNDGDGIYQGGGDQLLLTLAEDGTGGYTARFDIALELSGTTSTTVVGGTTSTTLAGGQSCSTIAACLASLQAALPDPGSAVTMKARRASRRLQSLAASVASLLDRAASSGVGRQTRLYGKARTKLQRVLAVGQTAAARGTLDVPLAPLETAVGALLGQIPA